MKKGPLYVGLAGAALFGVTAIVFAQSDPPSAPREKLLVDIVAGATLYAESCAACHGANLEGVGDWRSPGPDGMLPAPPHDETGHTWHHPDSLLFTYTKLGGKETLAAQGIEFNSGMPGFGDQLTDAEIWNILEYIKSEWPERISTIQSERTMADEIAKEENK